MVKQELSLAFEGSMHEQNLLLQLQESVQAAL